jgi:hypothetical protein
MITVPFFLRANTYADAASRQIFTDDPTHAEPNGSKYLDIHKLIRPNHIQTSPKLEIVREPEIILVKTRKEYTLSARIPPDGETEYL